jgi:Spy/CpxP family protein refolding chaperone
MSLTAFFALLLVGLAVVFGLTVAVAALTGWWVEFAEEDRAGECQMGKGGE